MRLQKDAVGYVRCSTEMQEDSPEQQKKEITAYAVHQGYRIIDWHIDFGKSGTTFDQRPAFQLLRRAVESKPQFSAVIVYDESRWGRAIDAEENTYWRFYFRKRGVDVILVKTSVDPKNEFAPMLKAFEGVQASQYSKKLSELTLRGQKANGIYSSGGTAPYGYKRIAVNSRTGAERELSDGDWLIGGQEKVKWALGPAGEVETVRLIFGERLLGKAYVLIAEKLNRLHISCPRRGRWKAKDRRWSGVTIKGILENPAYYGARAFNRNSMSKIVATLSGREINWSARYPHAKNDPSEWIVTEGAHPAIVDKETWTQANRLSRRMGGVRRNRFVLHAPYLLTGLVRCSQCGFGFQGQSTKAKSRDYSRYIDGGWANKRVCTFLAIPKEPLERRVIEAVKETLMEPKLIGRIEHYLDVLMREEPERREDERDRLNASLHENKERQRNLLEAIESNPTGGSMSLLIERLDELQRESERLAGQIIELERSDTRRGDLHAKADLIERYIRSFEEVFDTAPIEEKKLILQKCISGIEIDRDAGLVRIVVRRLPAVTQEIEELLYKTAVPTTKVVGTASSGGRT